MTDAVDTVVDAPEQPAPRQLSEEARDRVMVLAVALLTAFGAYLRLSGLSKGTFFRDDAWVALTHRVPLAEAWKMVGTAPGFTMFERYWTLWTDPSTQWAQLPTLLLSVLSIPLMVLVARWWGLTRWASVLAGAMICVSRIDVTYATHLKPYAVDVVMAALVLFAAEWWRRGHTPWLFAFVASISFAISFTIFPLVFGSAVVMIVEGPRQKRFRGLVIPFIGMAGALGGLYWAVHDHISPQLKKSWQSNFFSLHSVHDFLHSANYIFSGLLWGFGDTTPALHAPGFSKLFMVLVVVLALIGATRINLSAVPLAAVLGAVAFALGRQIALGTGRTDAYLYPALALLILIGADFAVGWLTKKQRILGVVVVMVLFLVVGFAGLDRATHRPVYPGGDITPAALAAKQTLATKGGVIVEGTARWPWTYYEVKNVRLVFSPDYNTGFAPISDDPNVVIMPGTVIEGGYDPALTVHYVIKHQHVLYLRTDDWPALGDPLAAQLKLACFHETRFEHVPGYLVEWLVKGTCPAPKVPAKKAAVVTTTPTTTGVTRSSSTPSH